MSFLTESIPLPLRQDESATIGVGETRVQLEIVIDDFLGGARPEEIVRSYDTLNLADVYVVIGFYLQHREEVAQYMKHQEARAEEIRRMIEARQPDKREFRERLMRRKKEMEARQISDRA